MGLKVIAGPANAGKVALLLERYLGELQREPILIVPNRSDVERAERDLLATTGALLGGWIGTFDDLFARIAHANGRRRPVATDVQRELIVRRVVDKAGRERLGRSAVSTGFSDSLSTAIAELEAGLLEPEALDSELGRLYAAYLAELDQVGLWDSDLERRYAVERVARELEAWEGSPVFAYGFEDLTGAQWALLEALTGRADVTVSLPYEPSRPTFASLARTSEDLGALARGRIEELPPAFAGVARPAIAHLERALFAESSPEPPPLEGAIQFLEGAGGRGTLELVGRELLELLRSGVPADEIAIVCPSVERWRASLETALGMLGVPFAVEGRLRLAHSAFGHALVSLLRFAWLGGTRRDLYAFLRSPYSGLSRGHVDFLEGRLRGRAVQRAERVEEETRRLRNEGKPLPGLDAVRDAGSSLEAVRTLAEGMLRAAHGLDAPPTGPAAQLDLRAHEAVARLLKELEGWQDLGGDLSREELVAAVERAPVRAGRSGDAGRVAVLDLLRARTRRLQVVFVLGLEEGSLPRRAHVSPFLDDDARHELDASSKARLTRPDPVSRDRYLFYTACTRATRRLYLVREAATDEGSPRQASPFWEEVRSLFPSTEVVRATSRRPLSSLTWPLEQAPTDRERLRSVAALVSAETTEARAIAVANGWDRRIERAIAAFERPTRLTHPRALQKLRDRATFGATELEVFADCSSMWLFDREISPRTIDPDVDARLRGSIAHGALHRFYAGLPKRLGSERVDAERIDETVVFLRECLDEAMGGAWFELTDLERRELEQGLRRDLEQFVRSEAESGSPLVPGRFEVSFGSPGSAPELQRGLELGDFALSGKIDRIDLDPFSARGIVQDYKSGKTAHSAAKIDAELRLQIPLYMLVLRDLIGLEPLGGVYRALAGERQARGLLRAEAKDDGVPGYAKNDYLDEEAFWSQIERAQEHARGFVERIRAGDVKHDPKGGFPCPSWCDLWTMCRVKRG